MQGRLFGRLVVIAVSLLLGVSSAPAQSGVLRGVVEDDTGAAIPHAQVILKNSQAAEIARTVGNDMGEFAFTGLAGGEYVVRLEAKSFKAGETRVSVGAGPLPLQHFHLKVAEVSQEITVNAGDPVSMDGNMSSFEVNHDLLKSLPVQDDDPVAAAQIFLDPAANGAEGTAIVVDGVEGNLDVPSSSVKSVSVNKNPYSAEFGRPGKGRIEVATRPGSLTRVHHHLVMTYRNSSLDARNAFASTRPDLERSFWEGDINGPLFRHKGSFYFGGDYLRNNQTSIINALVPDGAFSQNVPSPERAGRLLGRVDFQLNPMHTLSLRYNFNRDDFDNRGLGAFDLPERGYNQVAKKQEVRVGETALALVNFSNEVRFSYRRRTDDVRPLSGAPASIVLGAFSSGGAQLQQNQDEQIFL
ncbi:MAG TPA: carboxypeptidase-like regulatory domain-containing protein, partial [Candidatus Limnocylindrales bacterium]|nr:carboxypeptidase-like regulatory domain-containing protein [Candidatus Limnocylindrales bacterium]